LSGHFQATRDRFANTAGHFWFFTIRRNLPISERSHIWCASHANFPIVKIRTDVHNRTRFAVS
jgi:hypothetical protein